MKQSYQNRMIYAVKHLLDESNDKIIGFTCPDAALVLVKNMDVTTAYTFLSREGRKILLVNFDPAFSADFEYINAPMQEKESNYPLTEALKDVDTEQYDKILVNLLPVQNKEYLFDRTLAVKEIVLTIQYGATTYTHFEKVIELLQQNDIKLIGTLAHK